MKNVNYPKCRNVNSRFYSVLWCYAWTKGFRRLHTPFQRFRVRQLSKIRKRQLLFRVCIRLVGLGFGVSRVRVLG